MIFFGLEKKSFKLFCFKEISNSVKFTLASFQSPKFKLVILIFFCLFLSNVSFSQDKAKGTGPKEKSFKEELKSNRKLRAERREKRRKERAEKKAIKKYHKRLQTKKVRKRMKESRKASIRYNDNKKEFFAKKWFRKKGRSKRKK